jgi:hypothetical protein
MGFLGVEHRSVRIVLAEGLCDLGGSTSAEGLREVGRAPFLIMPWHSPYDWGKAPKTCQGSRAATGLLLRRLGCISRDCLGWPAGRQITPFSQVTSVSPRSAQVPSELPY